MRPIHVVTLDKARPAVILTREGVLHFRQRLTVAAITTNARGLSSEVSVGPANGLADDSVINCDDIYTVAAAQLGRRVGWLLDHQEPELAEAVIAASALEV